MRLRAWALLALSSALLHPLAGATRPHYGGTLTLQLSAADVSSPLPDLLSHLVAETLVGVNDQGDPEPQLAVAWQRDADRRRWRFTLRSRVVFHDGKPLNAASAAPAIAAALKHRYGDVTVTAGGQTLVVQSERAIPDLLAALSRPQSAIYRSGENGAILGTGPFRLTNREPGVRITLAAFEDYWGGRPYLDSVVVNLAAARAIADISDLPFASTRRVLPERMRIWSSAPAELIALAAGNADASVLGAIALAVDRAPIVNVLTQRRGEAAFSLLPQWLSGYAFLFATTPDLGRARQMIAPLRLAPLTLAYPANDPFARSVADRVTLNARDAGINIQPTQNPNANLHLVRIALASCDAEAELAEFAKALGLDAPKLESAYETERSLLQSGRVIPLVYLPRLYAVAARVHNWDAAQKGKSFALHLENVWVEP